MTARDPMDPDRRCQEELLEAEAEASTRATEECGAQPGKGPVLPEVEARRIGREICGSTIRIFNNNNNNNNIVYILYIYIYIIPYNIYIIGKTWKNWNSPNSTC
jgi:hypothetical protein